MWRPMRGTLMTGSDPVWLAERRGVSVDVYEAAEDSWLLASTVVSELAGDERVLDVGTGSGYVAVKLQAEIEGVVVGADINPVACQRAYTEGVSVVQCDLVEPFVDGGFDVVVFNPPYLPVGTDEDEWFSVAVAGGESGRAVIDRFLQRVGRVVAASGRVFLLVSSLTGVEEVTGVARDHGFRVGVCRRESYPGEELVVLELARNN